MPLNTNYDDEVLYFNNDSLKKYMYPVSWTSAIPDSQDSASPKKNNIPPPPKQSPQTPSKVIPQLPLDAGNIVMPSFDYSPDTSIDWDAIAKIFSDPRATPAFYKVAIQLLLDVLSHQKEQSRLKQQATRDSMDYNKQLLDTAVKMQLSSIKDISPFIDFSTKVDKHIEQLYGLYANLPNKQSPEALKLSSEIHRLSKFKDGLYGKIASYYGIPYESYHDYLNQSTPYDNQTNMNNKPLWEKAGPYLKGGSNIYGYDIPDEGYSFSSYGDYYNDDDE